MKLSQEAFPEEITTQSCYDALTMMYKNYKWDIEESKGRNPLVRDAEQLKYYAVLMYTWISSKPLSLIIANMINYYRRKGNIWHRNESVPFVYTNKEHINWVINDLIADIDNVLRFMLKSKKLQVRCTIKRRQHGLCNCLVASSLKLVSTQSHEI